MTTLDEIDLEKPVPASWWYWGIPIAILVTVLLMKFGARHMTAPVAGSAEATSVMYMDIEATGRRFVRFDHPPQNLEFREGAVRSSSERAEVKNVDFVVDGARMGGLLGRPKNSGNQVPRPIIVVCHPSDSPYVTGLHTATTVQALAEAGYLAFSPDYRGWGASQGSPGFEVHDVIGAIRAAKEGLIAGGDGRVGLLGFSMGGGIALRAAYVETNVQAVALYYPQLGGSLEELALVRQGKRIPGAGQMMGLLQFGASRSANDAEVDLALRQTSAIYHVARLQAPLFLVHGAEDEVVNVLQSQALENEARTRGKKVESHYVPGKRHAFANEWDGNDAREDLLRFFSQTLPVAAP